MAAAGQEVELHRERMRGYLAPALALVVAGILLAAFITLNLKGSTAVTARELNELLQLVFAPVIGLLGAVVGFYYGGSVGERRR